MWTKLCNHRGVSLVSSLNARTCWIRHHKEAVGRKRERQRLPGVRVGDVDGVDVRAYSEPLVDGHGGRQVGQDGGSVDVWKVTANNKERIGTVIWGLSLNKEVPAVNPPSEFLV